jgi:hypothetical protein
MFQETGCVIFDEWVNFRSMEYWEDVWLFWEMEGYCRVYSVNGSNDIWPIIR